MSRNTNPLKLLWFDCAFGVSGDMCLGALVDAGAPFKPLKELPEALGLKGVTLSRRTVKRSGLRALKVSVKVDEGAQKARRLRNVEGIISKAKLPDAVKEKSLKVFRAIFKAEAHVHGSKLEDVHLHEMGAADTLIDIVGSVLCIELLGVDKVTSSPVAVGSGTIKCAHGLLPVPPPAVAELLKGVPIHTGIEGMELATPTGAAIIREISKEFGPMPDMVLEAVGVGAGTRKIEGQPNALRALIGKSCRPLKR
ncbi:MAG: LarC family nickel insertion protein [Thermodesulfovibrionales bacterium]|nr:LarC family nickel insertion protein [Thermodesulfovibrionales bacterium]